MTTRCFVLLFFFGWNSILNLNRDSSLCRKLLIIKKLCAHWLRRDFLWSNYMLKEKRRTIEKMEEAKTELKQRFMRRPQLWKVVTAWEKQHTKTKETPRKSNLIPTNCPFNCAALENFKIHKNLGFFYRVFLYRCFTSIICSRSIFLLHFQTEGFSHTIKLYDVYTH